MPKLSAWSGVVVLLLTVAGVLRVQDAAAAGTRIADVPYTCGGKGAELDVTLQAPTTAFVAAGAALPGRRIWRRT
ncbi:hypothetical protein Aph01nite_01640 [Acrocarpospora phusangensis]|uniref:Uncharacterized protein n=1 Tax=Acrocarpospora phusangensis TaxID=1070424 RepID=A0A919Q3W2_9ACTN|nr:hypothetical protein Aph01nite_01640 [Acrocarpospora phusangensis]